MAPRPPRTALQPHRLLSALICSILLLLLLSFLPPPTCAEPTSDRSALQSFLSTTRHDPRRARWDTNTTACLWRGVTCDPTSTAVIALRLPGTGLSGPIPPSTPLANLTSLRYLSLRSNALSGPLPEPLLVGAIPSLRGLYLQGNRFSGEIPSGVGRMAGILRLDLSGNQLTGGIPDGLGNLTALTGLFLQGNRLSGGIPGPLANLTALLGFNVSENRLTGPIPERLGKRFPASAFAGNVGLCGAPLPPCAPAPEPGTEPPPGSNNKRRKKKLSTAAIIAIAVVGGALLLLSLLAILLLCCRLPQRLRRRTGTPKPTAPGAAVPSTASAGLDTATTSSTSKDGRASSAAPRLSADKRNKLVVLDSTPGDWYSFDLEDLLRASAEVLGKGALGTSYKAVLEEGATVVVKRLRGENAAVGKNEFEACMRDVARAAAAGGGHRNVQPLRAYYYSKDERLLLFDYVPGGSLSATLHANRGTGRTPLEWPSRLRIALTASRGLLHLHKTANLVHGNLKASNVLLRRDPDGAAAAVLGDYALHPLFGPNAPHNRGGPRASGYRAPERAAGSTAPTPEADVYGYGVLVLELLTGRSPGSPGEESVGGAQADLPRWVRSVVREEWTAEVLDADLVRYGSEEEMVRLLQVALACTEPVPAARPTMDEVVRMVQEVADAVAAAEGEETGTGKASIMSSSDDPTSEAPTPPAIRTP